MASFLAELLGAPFNAFHLLFLGLVGYWVSLDAAERGSDASLLWALGCVVFQPLVVGYLLYRSRIGGRTEPAGVQERLVGTFVIGHFVAAQLWFALRLLDVLASVTYPPVVELQYYLALLAVGVLPGSLLVWNRGWERIRRTLGWVHEQERETVQR